MGEGVVFGGSGRICCKGAITVWSHGLSAGQWISLAHSEQEWTCQLLWWGWNWERMISVLVVNLWAKWSRKGDEQCWWQRRVGLTLRGPVLHSPSLVWKSGEGNNFFSGLCWCLCPPALMQCCVCNVWEAEQGKAAGTQMPCSFSVLWPQLRPVVCHLNQTCLKLVQVRSGTGAGMYPDIPWLALLWETQDLHHWCFTALVGDALYPSLEWLSLSALKNALPPEEEMWALLLWDAAGWPNILNR